MKNLFWAALHLIPGIGNTALRRLRECFGSGESVWTASAEELKRSQLGPASLSKLIEFRSRFSVEQLREQLGSYNVKVCLECDAEYPARLREIFDSPFLLYFCGSLQGDEKAVGIVGARFASPYGRQVAQSISFDLAKAGFTIVSGAAKGIDTQAHIGALKAGGRTVAVLGCGLDTAYPAENKQLLQRIAQTGAVISEYPLGTEPIAGHFPARNRIINGLSKGILVVEAAKKSGSLITAELALSEGRDVFAVPGNIYSDKSVGCHMLIQQGAKLVTRADDIIDEYEAEPAQAQQDVQQPTLAEQAPSLPAMTPDEQAIYDILPVSHSEAKSTDEIIYKLRINVSNIAFILLQMKLKGLIEEVSPNFYARAVRECVK